MAHTYLNREKKEMLTTDPDPSKKSRRKRPKARCQMRMGSPHFKTLHPLLSINRISHISSHSSMNWWRKRSWRSRCRLAHRCLRNSRYKTEKQLMKSRKKMSFLAIKTKNQKKKTKRCWQPTKFKKWPRRSWMIWLILSLIQFQKPGVNK